MGVLLSLVLFFVPLYEAQGNTLEETVVIALGTATTQVQESEAASGAVAPLVSNAITQAQQAQQASQQLGTQVSTATSEVNEINSAITVITNATGIDQSSIIVSEAKSTVVDAQTAVNAISTVLAQSELAEATTARSAVTSAMSTASTEFSQANASISNAQDAINALQATIATVRDVLQGVDDAGVQLILPFNMRMGDIVYNSIFVGSNATLTFGVNEGHVFWDTPSSPSVSLAGMDWTTWSYGSGITYATTQNSLDIAWDLRAFPTTDSSIQLTQIRFNADVNPTTGAWIANVSGVGPHVDTTRWNYRQTAGGAITQIVDQDLEGTNEFEGTIGQGNYTAPTTTTNNSEVQAIVDSANAQLSELNQRITAIVLVNTSNQQLVNTIPSVSGIQNGINAANNTKANLQTLITTRATNLTNAINNYIPTPPPVIEDIVFEGGVATVSISMPEGYEGNTWFYTITADDENVDNPYAGQTLNTDGSPEIFEISGLEQGATYTISVANWSGPTSVYDEFVLSIPAPAPVYVVVVQPDPIPEPVDPTEPESPDPVDPTEPEPENPTDPEPVEPTDPEPVEPEAPEEPTTEPKPTQEEVVDSAVEDALGDGKITAADAEEILDALNADGEITSEEVNSLSDALSEDGKLTKAEKDLIADALLESVAEGETLTSQQIEDAGIEYKDLPAETPVDVRTDENGNAVIIIAEVAAALQVLESPAAFIGEIFGCITPPDITEELTEEQKCQVLAALANIGADMSPEERKEATDMVIATVVAAGAAINAAAVAAAGGSTGGSSSGGGSSGGGSGANSPGSRGGRKW